MRNDTGKNCNLAKISGDIGARGGECWTQREIGERLGVDAATVNRCLLQNCNLAKMQQDLGEQWNEQGVAEWASA